MANASIRLPKTARDRLALLATERNTTMRDLLAELVDATPTQAELQERYETTLAVLAHEATSDG